ncbi:50S ribosomal protein L4 [Candidatus Woesearchaeota archaeon]|nr:50S ribosomal protein L4 [Candidatus Woesearchaeota archaeon]
MKADILDLQANKIATIELPSQFDEEVRPDLIRRAFKAVQSSLRQPYGAYEEAGFRQYAYLSRRRRDFKATYGRGMSRAPRKIISKRGSQFIWIGAFAPGTVGGRRAHPPKVTKIYAKYINKKEKRKAIRSALSASLQTELIKLHGHKFYNAPLILEDKIESLSKSKEVKNILIKIGLKEELLRLGNKSIRPGKGKLRGRKYKKKTGPLIIVSKECPLIKAINNMQGFDIIVVDKLNAFLLAPGGNPGRLLIWSKAAIERLKTNSLFMPNKKSIKEKTKKIKNVI